MKNMNQENIQKKLNEIVTVHYLNKLELLYLGTPAPSWVLHWNWHILKFCYWNYLKYSWLNLNSSLTF